MTKVDTTCSRCTEKVTVDTETLKVTGKILSNGVRGRNHKPAHVVTVDAVDEGDLISYECPHGCGEVDTVYADDSVRAALT
jgi:hypothetical protein